MDKSETPDDSGDLYGTFSAQTSYFYRNYSRVISSDENSEEFDAFIIDQPNDQLVDDPGIYFDRQADWKITTTQSEQLFMFESPPETPKIKRSGTTEVLFKVKDNSEKNSQQKTDTIKSKEVELKKKNVPLDSEKAESNEISVKENKKQSSSSGCSHNFIKVLMISQLIFILKVLTTSWTITITLTIIVICILLGLLHLANKNKDSV